ncbi:hypothetical protein [uncultured Lacinutrix sp.]|uniref:hypothetical protein n=1 Tax=uncultured Lacinutrix sp. TaxID=574032 RepID=UPI00261FBA6A|nr:hypothetical protein [uncultured Lacinutrix sp.]
MKISKLFIVTLLVLIFTSCSKDDIDMQQENINNNIVVTIDEYPVSGTLITSLTTQLTGTLTYTLASESESGAFTLNTNTGELAVGDWEEYDYEQNPILLATVNVSNGSQIETKNIKVNINNIDDIWAFLNTSRTAYQNAAPNTWVKITQSEYENLEDYLSNVNQIGTVNGQASANATVSYDSSLYTYANNNGITVPAGSYVFAFSYRVGENAVTNSKVKISSTSVSEGYEDLGGNLPSHNSGYNYFVIKGNNVPVSTESYLAISAKYIAYRTGVSNYTFKYSDQGTDADLNTLPYNWNGIAYYHGLSTTLKQWN